MDISLSREWQHFVEQKVSDGQFADPSDVVRGALEAMKAEETWSEADLAGLRSQIAVGIEQLDAGDGRPWDVTDIKSRARARLDPNKP